MTTYKSFEELPVWKSACELATNIYAMSSTGNLNKDYSFKDQIRRSAISISSNIAEGFERGTKKEFIQFLYIARGSCGELRSQIHIAKNIAYLSNIEYSNLLNRITLTAKQINGFIEYLKHSKSVGQKTFTNDSIC
jgi:four helix bundle protein